MIQNHGRRILSSMQNHQIAPDIGAKETVAPIAPGRCAGIMPEFIRPADAVKLFGVGRSTLAEWIKNQRIKSYLLRREGRRKGMRLISSGSLREFIQKGGV